MRFIDLTHSLSPDVPTWNGNCGFHIEITKDYGAGEGVQFRTHGLHLEAGVGTHMDAPCHCTPGGMGIEAIPLEDLIVPGVVIDVASKVHEDFLLAPEDIENVEKGSFVIIHTGWAQYWTHPEKYRNNYRFPSVSKEAALLLLEREVKGLGVDTLSPDRPESGYPVHAELLGAGKYIVENVANSNLLPPKGFYSFALPMKITGATEAPMRLVAVFADYEGI
jgi:kynurenine formamidase